eukprot:CAMPEP_0206486248 /NCGR_PEP_ID=MMETSP0324_2-20121206/40941_1 /ASSEMBLY_ACC=CAM_ASM_000836 /TAXON_ID=2866 /ORGANISM="Crypthecodinium cohnii, Strain Seligo" /LENGTH=73 /DNA_ID=CAMNT_0053964519 /DNA_START=144 /DNA_END=365 /DNA_ORIENTATION=+
MSSCLSQSGLETSTTPGPTLAPARAMHSWSLSLQRSGSTLTPASKQQHLMSAARAGLHMSLWQPQPTKRHFVK